MEAHYCIGIDTGVNTGVAVWSCRRQKLIQIETLGIHRAMDIVKDYHNNSKIHVRVEDARLRKWFGNSGREQLQGAGSIKRDASIWEDFLKDMGISYEMVAPKNNSTKLSAKSFKNLTKWEARTSEHSRDAAMLVFGYTTRKPPLFPHIEEIAL